MNFKLKMDEPKKYPLVSLSSTYIDHCVKESIDLKDLAICVSFFAIQMMQLMFLRPNIDHEFPRENNYPSSKYQILGSYLKMHKLDEFKYPFFFEQYFIFYEIGFDPLTLLVASYDYFKMALQKYGIVSATIEHFRLKYRQGFTDLTTKRLSEYVVHR